MCCGLDVRTSCLSNSSGTVKPTVSSLPGTEPAGHSDAGPAESRGPSQHTATEPPARQHTEWEELIQHLENQSTRPSRQLKKSRRPTECTRNIINRTRKMEAREEA